MTTSTSEAKLIEAYGPTANYLDPGMADLAQTEMKLYWTEAPSVWGVLDDLRLASKMARAATGSADGALVAYLMTRLERCRNHS